MKVIKGDIWKYYPANYIVIPTNGTIKSSGEAVMGAGLAKQLVNKQADFPIIFGEFLNTQGNKLGVFGKIITFPVKYRWYETANLRLLEQSSKELKDFIEKNSVTVYMPKVGCGCGRLNWKEVEPILNRYVPNVTIIDWNSNV